MDPTPNGNHEPQRTPPAAGRSRPHRTPPLSQPTPTPINIQPSTNKKYRANIKIASLNMKGRTSQLTGAGPISKWSAISKTMREKKIGLLALQETHLSEQLADQAASLYQRRLTIINAPHTLNPTSSASVAFIINKELIKVEDMITHTLIPGRAIFISFKWHPTATFSAINIYAPNDIISHPQFWNKIKEKWEALRLPNPDLLLGDFNLTEDPIDRAPARNENENAVTALRNCRQYLGVRDSWRLQSPTERAFTFTTHGHTMSRIDRIYTEEDLEGSLSDWSHDTSGVPTDHKMVSVRIAPTTGTPLIGKDRWSWPLGLLHDKELNKSINSKGIQLCSDMKNLLQIDRSSNPQTLWQAFKDNIKKEAVKAARKQIPKITQRISALKKDLSRTWQNKGLDTSSSTRTNAVLLEREIGHLEIKKFRRAYTRSQALWHLKGEKINKYWTKVNNPRKLRDIIHHLLDPQTGRPVTRSDKMAELARDYHEKLQSEDLSPQTDPRRQDAITDALSAIPDNQVLDDPTQSPLNHPLRHTDLEAALNGSKLGSAAGPDGIPYEVWKLLHTNHKTNIRNNKPSFDVLDCMLITLTDIQKNGVDPRTRFTLGWMCPIYKKKEKDLIKNYRPITLLNTDYKLLTKSLSTQLTTHIHSLVHPDQYGFIPSRSIYDPIRLNQTLCAYADFMEENGAIVALDQEKAYDKIDHHYLLTTLKKFNLPNSFIDTVQSLYNTAETAVLMNGVLSSTYKITRGVRQGDPLSCLLFNLAIEPLACRLRTSPELDGFEIPGIRGKLIVSLYADDTTIYLSESDSYTTLQDILSSWCLASGAKFNLEKTEVIPIGTRAHRERIWTTRKVNGTDQPLPQNIRIAEDGSAVRCLGAWIGNNTKASDPWEPVLDKVRTTLQRWSKGHPTLDAKRHIVQMFTGGMTQFLTTAQGMPKQIEDALIKTIREFIWESTAPPTMSMSRLYAPIDEGGINLLNISARNKAIDIIRLKSYLDLSPYRPKWAYLTDAIINTLHPNIPPKPPTFPLSSWSPPSRGPRAANLPFCIRSIIKTAKESKLTFAPMRLSKQLKLQLPAWFHLGAPPRAYNRLRDECLKTKHKVGKVKNLRALTKRLQLGTPHQPHHNCPCDDCKKDRIKGCKDPHKCALKANTLLSGLTPKFNPATSRQHDNLTLTHRRIEKNNQANIRGGDETTFNPTVTTRTTLADCFRVFISQPLPEQPATRPRERDNPPPPLTVYTDGSCVNNGFIDAQCGAGIWVEDAHPMNRAIKIQGSHHSNQIRELAAVLIAVQTAPKFADLTIITDSIYIIRAMNSSLKPWEDLGWTNIPNAEWLKATAYHLRQRSTPTRFKWVKGHNGTRGNEEADKLANIGMNKQIADEIDLTVPNHFQPTGLRLAATTQASAYALIAGLNRSTTTRRAEILLERIRATLETINNHSLPNHSIWKGCRHRDIRHLIQTFIFKAINDALRIGDFWSCIPNLEH